MKEGRKGRDRAKEGGERIERKIFSEREEKEGGIDGRKGIERRKKVVEKRRWDGGKDDQKDEEEGRIKGGQRKGVKG